MAFPILIAVIPVIKLAATAAAAAMADVAGQRAGERLFDRERGQNEPSGTGVNEALAEAQEQAAAAAERAETAEQALRQERAMRRTLARVALPAATLTALAAGILMGWLLLP